MSPPDLQTCEVDRRDGVLRVVIDRPPIKLMDVAMMKDLYRLVTWIEREPAIRVVVVCSRDEEFFIAHADVGRITTYDDFVTAAEPDRLNGRVETMERWRRLPIPAIAVIAGIAHGGRQCVRARYAVRLDRTAGPRSTRGCFRDQPRGGRNATARCDGRSPPGVGDRVGAEDVDAQTAERYGCVNRTAPDVRLEAVVERLAARIASFPVEAVAAAKRASSRFSGEVHHDLLVEQDEWQRAFAGGEAKQRVQRFLDAGGQAPHGERWIPDLMDGA